MKKRLAIGLVAILGAALSAPTIAATDKDWKEFHSGVSLLKGKHWVHNKQVFRDKKTEHESLRTVCHLEKHKNKILVDSGFAVLNHTIIKDYKQRRFNHDFQFLIQSKYNYASNDAQLLVTEVDGKDAGFSLVKSRQENLDGFDVTNFTLSKVTDTSATDINNPDVLVDKLKAGREILFHGITGDDGIIVTRCYLKGYTKLYNKAMELNPDAFN